MKIKMKIFYILAAMLVLHLQMDSARAFLGRSTACDCKITSDFYEVYMNSAKSCEEAAYLVKIQCEQDGNKIACEGDRYCERRYVSTRAKADVKTYVCSVLSDASNTYLGQGLSKLAADVEARQKCSISERGGAFCQSRSLCSQQERQGRRWSKTHKCSILSSFDKMYSGRGFSTVEAVARARQVCTVKEKSGVLCQGRPLCSKE